jgi:molybdopterin converting factor small subunit
MAAEMGTMAGTVTVRYFAGAARAMGVREHKVPLAAPSMLATLIAALPAGPEGRGVLGRCSWLIDGRPAAPSTLVSPGAVLDALPPFAGG